MPGSIRKFTIEGISYPVAGDTDLSESPPSRVKNEMIPTSGKGVVKKTFQVPKVDIELVVTPTEADVIKSEAAKLGSLKFSYTDAEGNVKRCTGQLDIESYSRQENKLKIAILLEDEWTLFPAS